MADAGILAADDRVELIEGEIVCMTPIGSRHAACVDRLTAVLIGALRARAIVRVQSPIVLDRRSEPQPDLSVLRPRDDFYAQRHPRAADVLLLIEVLDSSGRFDRSIKLPLYARAGISEVWLVNLPNETVERYRRPTLRGYEEHTDFGRGTRLALHAFPRLALRVDDIIG